ncbi:phosphoadenylyl-sulfate reductase [Bacillus sp. 1P06AnD]|uniref:phosphoadenylyl-sulfate reductase n=1 Tax=Bacillus sp. 1P06AnD TaxID=3132208 RepID=UPI0039A3C690
MGKQLAEKELAALSDTFSLQSGTKGAKQVLKWAYGFYHGNEITYASSFGAEAIVLIDLIQEIKPDAHILFLDTGLHFPETYDVIDTVRNRFPALNIEMKKPSLTIDEQMDIHGPALWERDPNACCYIRKVLPLKESLDGKAAWISGLRREQSPTRALTHFLNIDSTFRNVKICPLIHWTWKEVREYISLKDLPYNSLHDRGYPSIGCFPCTQPAEGEADSRAGRWKGSMKTECGLHPARNKDNETNQKE